MRLRSEVTPMTKTMIDRYVTLKQRVLKKQPQLATTAHISGLLTSLGLSDSVQEELWVVSLDGSRNVRTVVCAAKGGYHDCPVSMPTILSPVYLAGTDRFFVAHNHPSGQLNPTDHDFDLTGRLVDAAEMLDLIFEDHVIVGPGGDWYSLRGHGQLKATGKHGARRRETGDVLATGNPPPPTLPRPVAPPPPLAPKIAALPPAAACEKCGTMRHINDLCACGWYVGTRLPKGDTSLEREALPRGDRPEVARTALPPSSAPPRAETEVERLIRLVREAKRLPDPVEREARVQELLAPAREKYLAVQKRRAREEALADRDSAAPWYDWREDTRL